jgi:tetratricopeptide (TPR) repeat protein
MATWYGKYCEVTPEQEERLAEVWRLRMEGIKAAKRLQNEEAEAFYWQSLRLHEETFGPEHPSLADSLGALAYEFGRHSRHSDAAPLIERAMTLLRQKPGPEYRGILQTLDGLASFHHERGRLEEAERYYLQALAAREELLGQNHPRVAATLEKYAELLRQTGRESEADAMNNRFAFPISS